MKHLYWTGPRESDIAYTGEMFDQSATFYGSNTGTNVAFCTRNGIRINHNEYNQDASDFILAWQLDKIKNDSNCRFMAYNPNCVYDAPELIKKRTLCLNNREVMEHLNSKIEFRELASVLVPLLPAQILKGEQCTLSQLRTIREFEDVETFIIQQETASGGQGTFLFSEETEISVLNLLKKKEEYIVSKYINKNVSINIHAILCDKDIILFPGSVQIVKKSGYRLLYRGADYITYLDIEPSIRGRIDEYAMILSRKIQEMGYRGVIGYDVILDGEKLYFLEANNRFQGSSILLNRTLFERNLPSLQEMNLDAFSGREITSSLQKTIKEMTVPYSIYTAINEGGGKHSRNLFQAAPNEKRIVDIIKEGYCETQPMACNASQFSLIFNCNITSLADCGKNIRIHPNVAGVSPKYEQRILSHDWSAIKISVLNRGAVLTDNAQKYIEKHGRMRVGTYFSLDLLVNGIYINCPLYIKLNQLSPYQIDVNAEGNSLCLNYYGQMLGNVTYDMKYEFPTVGFPESVRIEQICFLATDRLRIQQNAFCIFSRNHMVCRFCEASSIDHHFSEEDIIKAIEAVFSEENLPFRHILIGGLSNQIGSEKGTILRICKKIRQYSDMPIYLMCLPPNPKDISDYYHAGITEFGFNIEIYDRFLAKQYMPGKGYISLERYQVALAEAVRWVGNSGAVRSAFIVGLEPMTSLLQGIEMVCRMGVAPILSVFRPIPGTDMEEMVPPSDEWLYKVLLEAEAICNKYGLSLGPQCPACRNNTLTVVKVGEANQ